MRHTCFLHFLWILLLLTLSGVAHADSVDCTAAPYNGLFDGSDPAQDPLYDVVGNPTQVSQVNIDGSCTFKNYTADHPFWANISFYGSVTDPHLVIFDNVIISGQMSCGNVSDKYKIWFVNGSATLNKQCQDLIIPVEAINKLSPAEVSGDPADNSVGIGEAFTYTMNIPVMYDPASGLVINDAGAENELHTITIEDDLSAAATGADLTYISHTLVEKNSGTPVPHTVSQNPAGSKYYVFTVDPAYILPIGEQLVLSLTVVPDATNAPGTTFVNTATWTFGRLITQADGTQKFFDPLPGENGVAQAMIIAEPDFVVNKSTPATAVNLTDQPTFTIDVQNIGGADAWQTEITDNLPTGMCDFPLSSTVSASVLAGDGSLVRNLSSPTDYTVSYSACQLVINMTQAGGAIAPSEHLNITYQSRLDSITPPGDGTVLTNVAGATQWLSSDGTYTPITYTKTLSDGTPGVDDYEDSASVTAALSGYYFEKTVTNLETGAYPATTASPGDRLRYKLRVFNVDQTIEGITITDPLDLNYFEAAVSNVSIEPASAYSATWNFDSLTGNFTVTGVPLTVSPCYDSNGDPIVGAVCDLTIEFDVTLKAAGLANGDVVSNQATLDANGGFSVKSDEPNTVEPPYTNIVADPDVDGDENSTDVTIQSPGPLAKTNNGQGTAKIGEQFTYTITVPATPSSVPLYDMAIRDDLSGLGPDLKFVSAQVLSGGTWTLINSNSGVDPTNKDLIITAAEAGGMDILPSNGGQVTIAITVEALNTSVNQDTLAAFTNSAYYTYNRVNGDDTSEVSGGADIDEGKTIVEPVLDSATATKSWSYVGGKAISEPAEVGDIIEYTISVTNSGTSTAYDTSVADLLPSTVALDTTSPTATIGVTAVGTFVADPTPLAGGEVAWGRLNGDDSLDIPPGETLVLTYQVTVLSVGVPIVNSAYIDWTSLDGDYPGQERTGDGCPTIDALNDYCVVPTPVTIQTTDTNAIDKLILGDSYSGDSSVPPVLRVGDTVDYQLTVHLHEGITENVVVEDTLPPGMELTGPPTITESAGATFTPYTVTTTPSDPLGAGDSGTLQWSFGNIENLSGTSNADATDQLDDIVITYTAVVVTAAAPTGVDHVASISDPDSTNHATLAYTGGDPTSTDPTVYPRLNATQTIDIHQPIMTPISKDAAVASGPAFAGDDGTSAATAYEVDVANNILTFTLQTCNETGLAPAYNLAIQDTLPVEMDIAGMVADPVVKIGADLASAVNASPVTDYAYSLTGTVMNFTFTDARPIASSECVFVQYDIGFASNIAPNTPAWSNTAEVLNYWSLPSTSGREYTPTDTASVYMTNPATLADPIKAIAQPVPPTDTVTIGEEVDYTITIPATNANLTNVLVEDNLDAALTYLGASEANGLTFTDNSSGQVVSITIDSIPAGQDAVITLRAQVADNGTAVANYSFDNQASYTYNGTTLTSPLAGPLTIVEPALVPSKSVTPTTPPIAGDTLTYTITIPAQTATNTSQAFDLSVVDTLGDGLNYVGGTAQINGMTVSAPLPDPTLGTSGTQQTLTWAGLDIPFNQEVTITYDVVVQDSVVPSQQLANSAYIEWSSLDTAVTGERTYSTTVTSSLNAADTASLTKAVVADSYVDTNPAAPSTVDDHTVRIGDTVDYQLTLNLQEGTTQKVQVTDDLPPGLAFDSLVSVTAGTNITYSTDPITAPSAGATGQLTFALGDVVHTPDADTDDAIVITYRVRVLKDTLTQQATTTPISNSATLSYTGSQAGNTSLQYDADITVLQPVIDSLTKTDRNGLTSPAQIDDVANTTMAFRLEACNSGAAPAYNMTVTDTLDTIYFDETSISIVGVSINGTSTGNYTYTYSSPDMTLAVNDPVYPGQCVDVDYDIGFRTDFGANQTWINSFDVSEYWSLPQPDANAQRFPYPYSPVTVPAPFVMTNNATVTPPTKSLLTSPAEATIGEEVVYQIAVPGAVNNTSALYDVAINDPLDANLEYASVTVTGLSGSTVTNNSTVGGSSMDIIIDQIPAGEQAIIELHARVHNELSAQQGVDINNTVSFTYANTAGGATEPAQSSSEIVTVNIVEPDISTISKTADKTTATTGEIVRYSVTLTAASGADSSDVFDVTLTDTLDEGLAYAGNPTVTVGSGVSADNTIGAPDITGDGSTGNPQTLVWSLNSAAPSDIDIAEGESVTISYDVQVLDNVLANQTLNNSVVAQWTGRDGLHATATDYERDGSDGSTGLNNYITASATAPITTPDTNTITKAWSSDTYADGAENVRIGDTVDYSLILSVQEGTLDNLVLADTLPQGLEFAGIVSINGNTGPTYTAAAPFSHADITSANVTTSGDATTGPTTVTWYLGSVTNAQNDGLNNDFVIVYRARVLNNVFAHSNLSIPLNNTVDMSYDTATGRVTKSDTDTVITALQPQLTVSKSVAPAGGDTVVDGGEVVTYTVDIENTGTAPAYDVVLQDIIPDGMRTAGVTAVNTYLVSSPQVAPSLSFAPVYDSATGAAVWNFDDGNTPSAYTIPVGDTLRVIYSVTVDSNVGAGLTLTNTAQVTHYYSLNNDDVSPVDSAIYRENYSSNTDQTSVTTALGSVLSKDTTQPSAGIGEPFTYNITVPSLANPATTALNDVTIYDNLAVGGADLEFISAAVLPGSSWSGTLQGSVDASGIVTITTSDAGGIDIPAGGHLLIAVTVRLLDTANNNTAGLTFTNRAWYTYSNGTTTFGDYTTTGAESGSMIVAQPDLTMTKTGPSPATMRIGTPSTFSLDVQNTGTSDAWNVSITDWLPNPTIGGMCDAGVSNVTATIYQADGTTVVQSLVAGTDYQTSFTVSATDPRCEFVLNTEGVSIAPTERLIVTYSVEPDSDNLDGTTLTNIAGATQWYSANPADGVYLTYTKSLTDGTVGTTDHEDAYTVTVQGAVLTSEKTVENLTTGQSGANASPGDKLRYTITVLNTTDIPMSNFSLVDVLDSLNATPMFQAGSLANVSVPAGATFTISGNTLNVDGLNIVANGSLTVSFEADLVPVITSGTVVLNQGQINYAGTLLSNTDDPAISGTEDPTETLISSTPEFEVWKTSADLNGGSLEPGDTLLYTITVKNIGDENANNATLSDLIPAYTTYVANSTTLNGSAVTDPSTGVSPLQNGMLINAPEDTTPGAMRADASATTSNVATITFEVTVNSNVVTGTVISNQGHVNATSAGTGSAISETLSDDPTTAALDDPTIDVIGNLVLIDAQKTVQLLKDNDGNGFVSAGDELRYTINISNQGSVAATGVTLVDAVPALTSFVSGSVTLNGNPVSDTGVSPLITGIQVNSSDGAGAGVISAGQSAVVTFDVSVDATAAANDVISNQGTVSSNEQLDEPTDADGIDSNGDQPTTIVVGASQLLSITKDVFDLSGGDIVPGDEVEYVITVQNVSAISATDVVITDSIPSSLTYVNNTATLNGSNSGVVYSAPTLTANYVTTYGDLAPGATAVLRFRATVNAATPTGTTITNTAVATWDAATKNASASASFLLGTSGLSGTVWLDTDFDNDPANGGPALSGWTVQLYRNTSQIGSVLTDTNGAYQFAGVAANATTSDVYSIRFLAPGAGSNTAKLGYADSPFTNDAEMQYITDIKVSGPTGGLNMPVRPNGVVYNTITRSPVAGATLRLLNASSQVVPSSCFDDPAQQGQVTLASGYYRFDLNFSDTTSCPTNGNYTISVTAPATGYRNQPASQYIQPQTTPLDVPTCSIDAVPSTTSSCEVVAFNTAPPSSIVDGDPGATYYLNLTFDQNQVDVSGNVLDFNNQAFNNHIPLDPDLSDAVAISKTAAKVNVSRGEMVPYTITVNNGYSVALQSATIRDIYPAGFKYVKGSSRFDGKPVEPVGVGNTLSWENVDLTTGTQHTIKLVFIVGSGVSEGDYVNRAVVIDPTVAPPNNSLSGQAEATVRVIPDPNFDCTDVIGKVFDDKNLNGVQDDGEDGIQGARLVTARGLIVTSDKFGRFHITCAVVPNESRGSNYILKLDDRSLPSGYRVTTENPRVLRATRGKMLKFNFGATIHHVVRLDVADGVFEPGTTTMRQQWVPRIGLLLEQLKKSPSVLRISYLADVEDEGLVSERMSALKKTITKKWEELNCCYKLTIETEIYWRRGAPPERSDVID